jgi:signal transduction histidine kinase
MSGEPPAERSFWERTVIGWHVAFYIVVGLVALVGVLDREMALRDRLALWALLALLSGWYALLGRHVLGQDDNLRGAIYALVAIALFAGIYQLTDAAYLLLFVLFAQLFAVVEFRYAVPLVVLLSLAVAVVTLAAEGWTMAAATTIGASTAISIAFAIVLGLWIHGIINESNRRAALVEELRTARAELAEAHHQAGVLAERERLAHEIHDTLAQGFTSILMLAQAADAAVERNPAVARQRIELIEDTARENLAEARSLVVALGPVDLASGSLREALGRLVQRFGAELELDVEVNVSGAVRSLPANVEVVLLRATQEALANVRKHAKASRVDVTLSYAETAAQLQVTDDGRGFRPGDADGFGLRAMRARVQQVGGRLDVRSGPGEGTTVSIVVATDGEPVS